jgi:hypothetical protein
MTACRAAVFEGPGAFEAVGVDRQLSTDSDYLATCLTRPLGAFAQYMGGQAGDPETLLWHFRWWSAAARVVVVLMIRPAFKILCFV